MARLATTSIVVQLLGVHVTVIAGGGAVATVGSVLVAVIVVVLAMTLLFLATGTTTVVVALYYLARVRPRLNDAMRRTDTVTGPVSDSLVRSRT